MKNREYKVEGCFIDENKKFAFIHIYKNASISMRNALGIRGKYEKFSDILQYNPITICIIRNPLNRIISSYQYLLRLEDNGFPDQHPTSTTLETDFYKLRNDPVPSFIKFLDYIEQNGFYDAVTLPQTEFLKDRNISLSEIDEVLVQERISDDFEVFKKKYKLADDIHFPSDNKGNHGVAATLAEYIEENKDIKSRIQSLYKDDFNMYAKLIKNSTLNNC